VRRAWGRIFAINFVFGVVTGIPMEFQFGTTGHASRGFQAASSARLSPWKASSASFWSRPSWASSSTAKGASPNGCIGSRLHGFCRLLDLRLLIIATDAWMQHPVAFERLPNGQFVLLSFWQLLLNPWGLLSTRTI